MIVYDNVTKENIKENNSPWPQSLDHPSRISPIGGSGSGKTNALLSLIKQQNDDDYNFFDKIYLYVKDRNEIKSQYLIKKNMEKLILNL